MRILLPSVALVWAITLVSCSRSTDTDPRDTSIHSRQSSRTILATVGNKNITIGEFQAELNRRPHGFSPAQLLEEMVRFEVLLAKAKSAGYDRDPSVLARVNELIVAKFEQDQSDKRGIRAPIASEADVTEFYQRNRGSFASPESVRVSIIFFKCSRKATAEKKDELVRKAEEVLARARAADPQEFSQLVHQYSEDQATRYAGGEIGWLIGNERTELWDPALVSAAFAIEEPGKCAPLIITPNGFYIVRLIERRPASVRPLAQVKDAIAYQLTRKNLRQQQIDFYEEMKQGLRIEMKTSLLKTIPTPLHHIESTPPPTP